MPPAEPPKTPETLPDRPGSLGAHVVPPARLAAIEPHAARLGIAAREIGDALPFSAEAADFFAVLEAEGE